MNEESVRSYLLGQLPSDQGQSLYGVCRYYRNVSVLMLFLFLIIAFLAGVASNDANIVTKIVFVLLIATIPINVVSAWKFQKNVVANWEISTDENKSPPKYLGTTTSAFLGASCGVGGMLIASYFMADISQTAAITIVLSIMVFLTISVLQ